MPLTCEIPGVAMPAVEMIREETCRPESTWFHIGANVGVVMCKHGGEMLTGPWLAMSHWLLGRQSDQTDPAAVVEAIWPAKGE